MMLIVCPTARPSNVPHVLELWHALERACDIAFCPAPGLRMPSLPRGAHWLRSTRTIGEARNVGLALARTAGHGWAVFWDDDNYYGPRYTAQVEAHAPGYDVLTAGIAFVRHDDGLWLYPQRARFYPGHATAVRVAAAEEFPAASFAEDVAWSKRMQATRARVGVLPPWGLVYDRRSPAGHAYPAEQAEFLRAHGPAQFVGGAPDTATDEPFAVWGEPVRASDDAVFATLARRAGLA